MTAVEEFAPAKVNLCLSVTGRRADGYHLLSSLVVFADIGDRVSVAPSRDLMLSVSGATATGVPTDDRNLVLKAAKLLRIRRGVEEGATINLEKALPHGGGIGGGSSDAAAAIRALARLWQVEPLSVDEALQLGADVPVCLTAPEPMIMRGIGEVLMPAPVLPHGAIVLINPGTVVPTGDVFRAHNEDFGFSDDPLQDLPLSWNETDFPNWLRAQRNDLERAAKRDDIAPDVNRVLDALREFEGPAGMSGSGSTCWLWVTDPRQSRVIEARLRRLYPYWWVRAGRVLGTKTPKPE